MVYDDSSNPGSYCYCYPKGIIAPFPFFVNSVWEKRLGNGVLLR